MGLLTRKTSSDAAGGGKGPKDVLPALRQKLLSLEVFSNHFWIYRVTKHRGLFVGADHLGNYYFMDRKPYKYGRRRRWVVFNAVPEASRVPPQWHAWLHYMIDEPPTSDAGKPHHAWELEHLPNATGTDKAYLPPGHTLKGGPRERATGDYEAWVPGH